MDTETTKRIVKFCAEECTRQHSGELSVSGMFGAWIWVLEENPPINTKTILEIGRMVDPFQNRSGFRTVRVSVGGSLKKVQDFQSAIGVLCDSPLVSDPVEFYRHFEDIHPFVDGNGRTGAILYNKMLGRLESPTETPDVNDPEFWSIPVTKYRVGDSNG